MFAFADETGNSGRNIFDENEYFRLGAILATSDIAPHAQAALSPFLKERSVERFHAHEWPEDAVAKLGQSVIDALEASGAWSFSLTEIHKPYMAPTKFVDVIFDAGENKAVPGNWYWDELNRHVLCLTVDSAMSRDTAKLFWNAFLGDDFSSITTSLDLIEAGMDIRVTPPAVSKVVSRAFEYARQKPAEFTLANTLKRKGYQANTPNVVAFTHLFQAIHDFASKHSSSPERLVHDKQDEFRKTLAETYEQFGNIIWHDPMDDSFPDASLAKYQLAQFEMPSSKDNAGLQATDLLLWVAQRSPRGEALTALKARLKTKTDDFMLSRRMSELIVHVNLLRNERQRGRDSP
ncbi:hypothetical protein X740_05120 [Mesorhizobium sp. LNHC221B00]|uniref:DUF3800 domain-containing protein n=1 Tax=Mesorhizobium sp. LNHC221B00 TaxID=1287233 RepID=UPI0003CF08B0|nr:DUF3800 domain-containing protein [Mesorhizobium sp. LNHC221B00]ESY82476.1 hypothetical protein X740_05120 [Mesorhizobium sp. LNHC221B00]